MYSPGHKSPFVTPSSSLSLTETVNGSHHFVIKGYSLAKGIGVGKHIASDNFTVGGYQWAIYFYPDGKNPEDNSAYVSVFIALASEGTDVRALFELTLVDQGDHGKHKVHSHFDRSLESGPYTLKYRGSMWWEHPPKFSLLCSFEILVDVVWILVLSLYFMCIHKYIYLFIFVSFYRLFVYFGGDFYVSTVHWILKSFWVFVWTYSCFIFFFLDNLFMLHLDIASCIEIRIEFLCKTFAFMCMWQNFTCWKWRTLE